MTLQIESLSVSFDDRLVLDQATLRLPSTQLVGLIGPNGAGKTSLLKSVAGLRPYRGKVHWRDRNVAEMSPRARARTISYLDQTPIAHWPMRVTDLVALGRLPHSDFGHGSSPSDAAAVTDALERTETTYLAERSVGELSGGEFARVQLARALCVQAPILLVDEPVALLDPYHQLQIMHTLRTYSRKGGLVVVVLHDLTLAARFCDRTILLDRGRILSDGDPRIVLTPSALRSAYAIEPLVGSHENEPFIVPWSRFPEPDVQTPASVTNSTARSVEPG